MNIRWKRWGAGAAGAVAVYALAGGWLLPHLIKSQLPKFAQTELERQATIGDVSFNPFTLRLEAQDVQLKEADGAPLFGVGKLAVELQWRSLLKRAWSLAEVRITAPSVQLAIAPDGKFNIAEFMATLDKRKHDDSDSGMPRLVIAQFALEQGKVEMHDRHAGYSDIFAPIDFALNNLSTLPDENGDYTLSADAGLGGKLRWKGSAALNPIAGGGELSLENVALPGMAAYLKSYMHASVVQGRLSAKLPYRFAYKDGKLDAGLSGAGLSLNDLAIKRTGATEAFVNLKLFDVRDVSLDLLKHAVHVGGLHVNGGALAMRRDAKGELDLANLMVAASPAAPEKPAAAKAAPAKPQVAAAEAPWKVQFKQIAFDDVALNAVDETVSPAVKLSANKLKLHLQLQAEPAASGLKLTIADAAFSLRDLALSGGGQTPFKLEQLGFDGGALDLAARHVSVDRVYADGGQIDLTRDSKGQFVLLSRLPKAGARAAATAGSAQARTDAKSGKAESPWVASIKSVELNKFGAHYEDASGIKANVQDFNLKVADAGTDMKQPLRFEAGLALREGGQLSAKGQFVPSSGSVDTDLTVKQLALAPVQPLLAKYVKLRIASGSIIAQGHLHTGAGVKNDPSLRYDGSFEVASLALDEEDNDRFAAWKSVRADKLALSLSPDLLDVAELRVIEPNATLIIENDRSFNAERLLVKPAVPATAGAAAPAAASAPSASSAAAAKSPASAAGKEPFPIRMRRVRFQNAKLAFTDLSLRPQFSARIYELNGVITGLSSKRDARSQIELDGRVDDYGLARIRGQLNPFVPADNTDVSVVFKNVDMVSASPYSMKFAGYKIAEGKISLDLQYKVRNNQLEGNNQIVLDNLTLGERIDSPDALKLPLELALAILKDSNGRIDLGVPVSGDMNDPQFSYGGVVWKAIGNIMSNIVTSPFRALGRLFGVSGEHLEAVAFDPGSAVVLPPEREKLVQVAGLLAKKDQLKLSVPGQYNEAVDGAALRTQALRRLVVARADIKLEAGEAPGPLDIGQRKVRGALRDLYSERFGSAELDKQKKAAEAAAPVAATAAAADAAGADAAGAGANANAASAAPKKLPMLQRLSKMVQGEPQVADASAFYGKLQERLQQSQPLAADALPQLGARRTAAILDVLKEAGVAAGKAQAAAPEATDATAGEPVSLKLGLSAK